MSVCRSSRHLLRRTQSSIPRQAKCIAQQAPFIRPFHQSSILRDDTSQTIDPPVKSDPSTVPAVRTKRELEVEKRALKRANEVQQIREHFVPYSDEQMTALSQYYTEAQMEALRAAEEVVSVDDLAEQWGPRVDQWKISYADDLAMVDPFADFKPVPKVGHAPVMRLRQERIWAPEDLEWTEHDEELAGMTEEQLKERFDREYTEWESAVGLDKIDKSDPSMSEEESKKMYEAMVSTPKPSLYSEAMQVDHTVALMDQFAAASIDEALTKAGKSFPSLLNEESKSPDGKIEGTPEQNAEEWESRYQFSNTLPEDPSRNMTKEFFQRGALTQEDIKVMEMEMLEQDFFNDHEIVDRLAENAAFRGLGITEMLYKIEKSGIAEEVKASLRPLYAYKGTHKELYVKRILWPFVTDERIWQADPKSYKTIEELFKRVQILKMDPIKKAELLAYSHWANTPKGDSLRPVLERAIAAHEIDPIAAELFQAEQNKKKLLGLDDLHDEFPLGVEGPNKHLYSSPIYSSLNAPIPKIKDPRVRYPALDDDALTVGLQRVSQQTGFEADELRRFRTKNLVFHRVVNQTRKGKIQSLYALCVAGNENGLVGIGEGKAFEPEDAILKARLAALRNLLPVPRYEKRTVFGELYAKVGGCTVTLMARPPGKFCLLR
jgi:Ribosomal protein S5, N-terminal domain